MHIDISEQLRIQYNNDDGLQGRIQEVGVSITCTTLLSFKVVQVIQICQIC